MSVIVTVEMTADANEFEEKFAANVDAGAILEQAKQHGVIAHRFYGSDDRVMVVDEWPDAESFQRFFQGTPEVGSSLAAAGVTGEPKVTVWRKLETHDEHGWDA